MNFMPMLNSALEKSRWVEGKKFLSKNNGKRKFFFSIQWGRWWKRGDVPGERFL